MRLAVVAVGRLKAGPEFDLIEDYAGRVRQTGRALGFGAFDIKEVEATKTLAPDTRRNREGDLLLDASAGGKRIVLDELGKDLPSADLARLLARWRDDGAGAAAFLIGGADGHDRRVRESADLTLAFGRATWPHMLVRVMLCEQIYRAMTILAGHPYHRA